MLMRSRIKIIWDERMFVLILWIWREILFPGFWPLKPFGSVLKKFYTFWLVAPKNNFLTKCRLVNILQSIWIKDIDLIHWNYNFTQMVLDIYWDTICMTWKQKLAKECSTDGHFRLADHAISQINAVFQFHIGIGSKK